jgi:type I restriction enzyme R subunit
MASATSTFQPHHQAYYELLRSAVQAQRPVDAAEQTRLRALAVELVDVIVAELSPYFFRPNRDPAQLVVGAKVFQLLVRTRLLANDALEPLVAQLVAHARANVLTMPKP